MAVISDPMRAPGRRTSIYPKPLAAGFEGRFKRALTELARLTQFGVNLTTLEPGAQSSHLHWHAFEDEFIYVLEGELVLATTEGEQVLKASMAAGFPAGDRSGHHLINRSSKLATYLEIGTRSAVENVNYPNVDLCGEKRDGKFRFFHKDGTAYE